MERKEVISKTITAQDGREITVIYSLVSQPAQLVPGCYIESYGVHVATVYPGEQSNDECLISNITVSKERIEKFIDLISRNGVTSVTLADVVDDMLGICL